MDGAAAKLAFLKDDDDLMLRFSFPSFNKSRGQQCLGRNDASFYPSSQTTRIFLHLKEFLDGWFWNWFVFTRIIESAKLNSFCDVHVDACSQY